MAAKKSRKIDLSKVPESVTNILEVETLPKLLEINKSNKPDSEKLEEGKEIYIQGLNKSKCSDKYYDKYRLKMLTRRSMRDLIELANTTIENGKNYIKEIENND